MQVQQVMLVGRGNCWAVRGWGEDVNWALVCPAKTLFCPPLPCPLPGLLICLACCTCACRRYCKYLGWEEKRVMEEVEARKLCRAAMARVLRDRPRGPEPREVDMYTNIISFFKNACFMPEVGDVRPSCPYHLGYRGVGVEE